MSVLKCNIIAKGFAMEMHSEIRLSMDAHSQLKVRQLASLCSQAGYDITVGKFCIEDANRYRAYCQYGGRCSITFVAVL